MNKQNNKFIEFFSSSEAMQERMLVVNRLFEQMREGVYVTDTAGKIQLINRAFTKITGYGEEVIGHNPRIFQSGKHDKSFYAKLWQAVETGDEWIGEIWNRKKDNRLYLQQTTITKIKDENGQTLHYAAVIMDVTERQQQEDLLQKDLLLAKEIQKGALSAPVHTDEIQMDGLYLPSDLLGGDLYVWYQLREGVYGIFVMDVMGHGVASSLVSMSVRALLRNLMLTYEDPSEVLSILNEHVYNLFRENTSFGLISYYLTCVYAIVDTKHQSICYAAAGHPPSFLCTEKGEVFELDEGTVPIGMLPTLLCESVSVKYVPNETTLFFYTDGLLESEQFRTRQAMDLLKEQVKNSSTLPIRSMMEQVKTRQLDALQQQSFNDDVTMVTVKL